MFNEAKEKELATEIYMRDGSIRMTRSLVSAKETVALKGNDDLDELDSVDVRVLAYLCTFDYSKEEIISSVLEITVDDVNSCLHNL